MIPFNFEHIVNIIKFANGMGTLFACCCKNEELHRSAQRYIL